MLRLSCEGKMKKEPTRMSCDSAIPQGFPVSLGLTNTAIPDIGRG
jgi:hypothetical protein